MSGEGDKQSKKPEAAGGRFGSGQVRVTNNKNEVIGNLLNVSCDLMGMLSRVEEIKLDGMDCKIVSRSLAINSDNNDYGLTLKTSHASTVKPVKDKKTRKWVSPASKK